jgi:hypothetical protein
VSQETQYRVFALSSEDIFPEGDWDFVLNWLRTKGNKPYFFRNKKPRNLPIGSFVLFSFEGRVFGRARTNSLVVKLTEEEQRRVEVDTGFHYTGKITFDPVTIEVFDVHPFKRHITERLGIIFSRNFTKLTRTEYNQIVRMCKSAP